jgi:hypothetical protein
MSNRKIKKTEGTINSGQPRDTDNIGHKTYNKDRENKYTSMKTKKAIRLRSVSENIVLIVLTK